MPTEGYVAMKQTALNLPGNATHLRRAWTFIGIKWFSSQKNWNVSRIRIRPLIHTKSCSALNLTGNAKDLSEVSIEFGLQIKSGKCEMERIWEEHEVLSQSINSIKCWIASSLYRLIPKLKNFQKSFKWPLCTEANLKWSFNLNYLTFTPKLIVAPKYVNLCPF